MFLFFSPKRPLIPPHPLHKFELNPIKTKALRHHDDYLSDNKKQNLTQSLHAKTHVVEPNFPEAKRQRYRYYLGVIMILPNQYTLHYITTLLCTYI